MPAVATVIAANLGRRVAALTCTVDGRPAAVVNTEAQHNTELRAQATVALMGIGLDAGLILGALYGVRR